MAPSAVELPTVHNKILTFDIEEWFHLIDVPGSDERTWDSHESRIESNVSMLLDICRCANVRATFFILGWIADRYPHIVRSIADDGHHIGCHSYSHKPIWGQTQTEFESDLVAALTAIASATGHCPTAYRAPGFSLTRDSAWVFEVLYRNGIRVDASLFAGRHAHGGWHGLNITGPTKIRLPDGSILKEYPFITSKVGFGMNLPLLGGGYFRLFPYFLLRRTIQDPGYAMTYFHPRDFDRNQPMVPNLSIIRQFRSYVGIKNAKNKLTKMLSAGNFVSVEDHQNLMCWESAPVISLTANLL